MSSAPIKIPLLGDIPVIGPLFFDVNIIVYMTYALIIGVDIALFRTRWGLRTRAVGEHPRPPTPWASTCCARGTST